MLDANADMLKDWLRLYKTQLPPWSLHVQFNDLLDPNEWKVVGSLTELDQTMPHAESRHSLLLLNIFWMNR